MALNEPCLEWDGCVNDNGYGVSYFQGKTMSVHRRAWIQEHGFIPAGMQVLHRCDNRRCYLVAHLFLGTQADNMADMVMKGRSKTQRLTADEVRAIRAAPGLMADIAEAFGIDASSVSKIKSRKAWRFLAE